MSGFGLDPFGLGPYGGAGAPAVFNIESPLGAWSESVLVDTLGGDVITVLGNNFAAPLTAKVMVDAVVMGDCYLFDERYDLKASKVYLGTPALPPGYYTLQITTPSGTIVAGVGLTYIEVARELKAERVRGAFSRAWRTGTRYLTSIGGA